MPTIPTNATKRIPPPIPNVPAPKIGVDPTKPYVAGRRDGFLAGYYAALPHSIDDVTRDFGDDLYERILNDAQASSCVQVLRLAACDGYSIRPAVSDKKKPGYKESARIAEWWETVLDNTKPSFADFLYQMSAAIAFGNKIAEKSLSVGDDGKWRIDCLAVKPRRSLLFVVDAFNSIVGLLSQKPTYLGESIGERYVNDLSHLENFLPREKFAIYTYMPIDGDPRGRSILRPAYAAWLGKVGTLKEQEKYLAQFASPSLVGTAPQGSSDEYIQDMRDSLMAFKNSSAIVVAFGSTVTALEVTGNGMAFRNAIDGFDRQIAKAILLQTLATEEGLHQTRAASEVHRGLLDYTVEYIRNGLADMVMNDILYPVTRYNEGDESARLYTPKCVVGDVNNEGWHADADAVFKLMTAGYLDPSQHEELDERLGLPARKISRATAEALIRPPMTVDEMRTRARPNGKAGEPDKGASFPGRV